MTLLLNWSKCRLKKALPEDDILALLAGVGADLRLDEDSPELDRLIWSNCKSMGSGMVFFKKGVNFKSNAH